ncbi:MAG TPA: hypothetical protein VF767_03580 [Bryobacteraceae bacterium]
MNVRLGVALIMAAGFGLPAEDPLMRMRAKMAANLDRLPDYTCLETIERTVRKNPAPEQPVDILRFEIAYVGGRELLSWPGEKKFENKPIDQMMGGAGAIGTGNFAQHARNLFRTRSATFSGPVEEVRDGHARFRWDFQVPRERSSFYVGTLKRAELVAYHGSFWVDPETLDLVRLETFADGMSKRTGISADRETIEYSRVRIGDTDFLLPLLSELTLVDTRGYEHRNRTRFSGCRQFVSESAISFADPPPAAAVREPAALREVDLPAGLLMDVRLEAPIDLAHVAIGDPIQAALARPLRKGSVDYPEGAKMIGRVTRMERRSLSSGRGLIACRLIGVQLLSLEAAGMRATVISRLVSVRGRDDVYYVPFVARPNFRLDRWRGVDETIAMPTPGEGVFLRTGEDGTLPAGLRLQWRTLRRP